MFEKNLQKGKDSQYRKAALVRIRHKLHRVTLRRLPRSLRVREIAKLRKRRLVTNIRQNREKEESETFEKIGGKNAKVERLMKARGNSQ